MQTVGILLVLGGWSALTVSLAHAEYTAETRLFCTYVAFLAPPIGGFIAGTFTPMPKAGR